ncbi:Di-copper centre-containing protein [Xylariaceae sp. FL0594]|nr:Di-copper centre-containing protein [Xylariaceae sp. FL0594]
MALSAWSYVLFICLFFSHGLTYTGTVKTYDYGAIRGPRSHNLQKRSFSQSSIVGSLPLADGQLPQRIEIRDLEKDADLWNLYILAVSWMQYTAQESPFSWYQIAGIHGAPGSTWGNVGPVPGNDKMGYCRHVSILFPTWHRPYLVLYEQSLYSIVQFIASLWPPEDRDRVQAAAKQFRIPYWDWAATPPSGESVLPVTIGGASTISVSGPNGVQNISNPLFSFTFQPFNTSYFQDSPFNEWNETKRAPVPSTDPNAISNNSFVAVSFDNHLASFQQRLYNLLSNSPNYTHFSNEGWIGRNSTSLYYDSVESLHDSVHTIGGGVWGHLAIIAYSAFDPIFFLHHANVDRIFAMWQVLNNNTWAVPTAAAYDSHTQNSGDLEDSETPLTPFFFNDTAFWTSDMVRDWEIFGYTYPEVASKNAADVSAAINRLYTHFSPSSVKLKAQKEQFGHSRRPIGDKGPHTPSRRFDARPRAVAWEEQPSSRLPMDLALNGILKTGVYREWIANIRVKKHALNNSFLVYLFLGDVPEDSSTWQSSDSLIGSMGIFAGPGHAMGSTDGTVSGTIPLTSALMKMVAEGRLPTLDSEDVEPFIRSTVIPRVALLDGATVEMEKVDGLHISIVSSVVRTPSREGELISWGEMERHFDMVG